MTGPPGEHRGHIPLGREARRERILQRITTRTEEVAALLRAKLEELHRADLGGVFEEEIEGRRED